MPADPSVRHVRTLFISDVHLGTRGCQAELLLDFLRYHDAETIYLVGDIVDGWRLKRAWYWPQSHNDVAQKLLRKARKGARVIYLPGNHDEFLRDYLGTHFGGIEVRSTRHPRDRRRAPAAGHPRRPVRRRGAACALARLLRRLGLYDGARPQHLRQPRAAQARLLLLVALRLGEAQGQERRELHRRLRGGAGARGARARRPTAWSAATSTTRRCTTISALAYFNCGDWVESCTALVEHHDGRFEIVRWATVPPQAWRDMAQPRAEPVAA